MSTCPIISVCLYLDNANRIITLKMRVVYDGVGGAGLPPTCISPLISHPTQPNLRPVTTDTEHTPIICVKRGVSVRGGIQTYAEFCFFQPFPTNVKYV